MRRPRVLVLENEAVIALDISVILEGKGFEVVGPFDRIAQAMAAVKASVLDAAILDVQIGSDQSFAVANALGAAGIPFLWATAYHQGDLPAPYRSQLYLHKPFTARELTDTLLLVLDAAKRESPHVRAP
jgi:DNA-binding response OmpR family regulator